MEGNDGGGSFVPSEKDRIIEAVNRDRSCILFRRRYLKWGYEYRRERRYCVGDDTRLDIAATYSLDGLYLGDPRMGRYLTKKMGIRHFERSTKTSHGASIGFNPQTQQWLGWSHRAICGFSIGDRIFEERFGNHKTPFKKHGRKTIKTLNDAKLSAKRFAASVS
jgi:hypothetical protein